jgi:hypothetical protein
MIRPSRRVISRLDSKCMRKFLYSKWFFAFLAFVCTLDLISDAAADLLGWGRLREVTIGLEIIATFLALTMFFDLHRRMKVNGRNPRG